MNERIEHCLYQAGLTAQGCWDELDSYAKEGIEKLAEIIIRECAEVACDYDGACYVGEAVTKHFGVEE